MPEMLSKETVIPPIKPPIGSPTAPIMISKSEIDRKAEEARQARMLPPKPGDHVTLKELNEWFKLLTPDMLGDNRVFVYVYRLDPPIIRQKVDPTAPNNIDVIADINPSVGIKEQTIVDRHGGGKYKLVVKDQDKFTATGGFFDARVIISQTDHPPKLDLREVDWDNPYSKGYKAYCRANRLIDDNNMPITPESQKKADATESSNATIAAMKLVMDYTSQLNDKQQAELKKRMGGEDSINKTFNDIILEKMKQDDPNKQLVALTTILTAMKSMQPEVKPDNTLSTILPIFMQMMTQMNESSNKQFQMMMEMVKIKSEGGGTDKGSVITEVKELFGLFQDMNGNGGVRKTTAEVIGGIVESNLTPVLQIISQIVTMKAASMGVNGVPGATHIPPVTAQGSPASPVSTPPGATPPPAAASLPSPAEATQIITQFGPIILNKLVGEGWEFGAWVSEGFGDQTAISIARYGVEQLLTAAKAVPQFWSQVERTYGEAYMRKWLTSFVNYKEEMNKMDDDEDEVTIK